MRSFEKVYHKLDKRYGTDWFRAKVKGDEMRELEYFLWLRHKQTERLYSIGAIALTLFAALTYLAYLMSESIPTFGGALILSMWTLYFLAMEDVARVRATAAAHDLSRIRPERQGAHDIIKDKGSPDES